MNLILRASAFMIFLHSFVLVSSGKPLDDEITRGIPHTSILIDSTNAGVANFVALRQVQNAVDNPATLEKRMHGVWGNTIDLPSVGMLHEYSGMTLRIKEQYDQLKINLVHPQRFTPLHRATASGLVELVSFLIDEGADEWRRDEENRWNVLHIASYFGHVDLVSFFLHRWKGLPHVNAVDMGKRSALHLAVYQNHEVVARLLIDAGVNVHARDQENHTAQDIALTYQRKWFFHR